MKLLEPEKPIKGIIFGGCSFTWGQGLYYYSNLSTLKEPPPHEFDSDLLTDAQLAYMNTIRFPRLVANYFNTFEVSRRWNGGSNTDTIHWWESELLDITSEHHPEVHNRYYPEEIGTFVFQITEPSRDLFINPYSNERMTNMEFMRDRENRQDFLNFLEEKNLTTLTEWEGYYCAISATNIKTFLQKLEGIGIKTAILIWPRVMFPYIYDDPWMRKKICYLTYRNAEYNNIADLMESKVNPQLTILSDYGNFAQPPVDHHPSRQCHQVIARNLIRHIKEKDLIG